MSPPASVFNAAVVASGCQSAIRPSLRGRVRAMEAFLAARLSLTTRRFTSALWPPLQLCGSSFGTPGSAGATGQFALADATSVDDWASLQVHS